MFISVFFVNLLLVGNLKTVLLQSYPYIHCRPDNTVVAGVQLQPVSDKVRLGEVIVSNDAQCRRDVAHYQ